MSTVYMSNKFRLLEMFDLGLIVSYNVVEKGWYRIGDDSGEDYLYPPEVFEIVKERSL